MEGIQRCNASELDHGLPEKPSLDIYLPLCKTKTRLIERPIFTHYLIPIAILIPERILNGFGELDCGRVACSQILVPLKPDWRRPITRISSSARSKWGAALSNSPFLCNSTAQ